MLQKPLHVAGVFLASNYFHVKKDREIMHEFYIGMVRMYIDPYVQQQI